MYKRQALSCIYRFHQLSGYGFGAGHLIDVLRGKVTEKVTQRGHDRLSTFGIGTEVAEQAWRGVLRQLIALGHVRSAGEFNTLELTDSARAVLKGEVPIMLRVPAEPPAGRRSALQYAQYLGAVGLELLRADAADAGQRVQRRGRLARHLGQRGVVEHHESRQVVLAGDLAAPGLERVKARQPGFVQGQRWRFAGTATRANSPGLAASG